MQDSPRPSAYMDACPKLWGSIRGGADYAPLPSFSGPIFPRFSVVGYAAVSARPGHRAVDVEDDPCGAPASKALCILRLGAQLWGCRDQRDAGVNFDDVARG